MNIGSLRHRIEFQRLETTYDKEGFPIEEYVTFQKLGQILIIFMVKNIGIVNKQYLKM